MERKKSELEIKKRDLIERRMKIKKFNETLNYSVNVERQLFTNLTGYLRGSIDSIERMDRILSSIDKSQDKMIIFNKVDLDALIYSRKNYKKELAEYTANYSSQCVYEKILFDRIQKEESSLADKMKESHLLGNEERAALRFEQLSFNDE